MKLKYLLLTLFEISLLSCASKIKQNQIPFQEVKNYFVNNSVSAHPLSLLLLQQKGLDLYFSPAATMGKEGVPTTINFNKESVVAYIGTLTNKETMISIKNISLNHEEILVHYRITHGKELSYTIRPTVIVKIPKQKKERIKFIQEP